MTMPHKPIEQERTLEESWGNLKRNVRLLLMEICLQGAYWFCPKDEGALEQIRWFTKQPLIDTKYPLTKREHE